MFTPKPEREPGDYSNRGWDYGRLCLTLRTVAIVVVVIAAATTYFYFNPIEGSDPYAEDIPFHPD